jgi:mannose/fructose/N-acetylgalactosamine-specific phosphotransferase system component IIC
MKKIITRISLLAGLLSVLSLPYFVFAASDLVNNLTNTGIGAGYNRTTRSTSLSTLAGTIVAAALALLGVIFVCLVIYGGVTWMMAEGDEAKVEKAQKIMRNAIVGLVLTISAYAIYYFIYLALVGQPVYQSMPGG